MVLEPRQYVALDPSSAVVLDICLLVQGIKIAEMNYCLGSALADCSMPCSAITLVLQLHVLPVCCCCYVKKDGDKRNARQHYFHGPWHKETKFIKLYGIFIYHVYN